MKKQRNMLVAGLVLGLMASCAQAAVIIDIQEVGNDVLVSGSGSYNLSALSYSSPAISVGIRADSVYVTPGNDERMSHYIWATTAPTEIGPGTSFFAPDQTTGSPFGVSGGGAGSFFVPEGYVSGSALAGTSTYENKTLVDLGLTEGTYEWTWGTGETADTVTVNIGTVPEPATMSLLALGGMALLRRKKK